MKTLIIDYCCNIGDEGVSHFTQYATSLSTLSMRGNRSLQPKVSDKSLLKIANHCPQLNCLFLRGLMELTDQGLKAVFSACTKLQILDLGFCSKMTDQSADHLFNCIELRELQLEGCFSIQRNCINRIVSRCKELSRVGFAGCLVDDNTVVLLLEGKFNIEALLLAGCPEITDKSITKLTKCSNLRFLNLRGCDKVTAGSMISLAKSCPNLELLHIATSPNINESDIDKLKHLLPRTLFPRSDD